MTEGADKDSKTEEGSEKKVRDALDRGNVPTSREAPLFASLCAALLIAVFVLRDGTTNVVVGLSRFLDNPAGLALHNGDDAMRILMALLELAAGFMVPIFAIFIVTGLTASGLQNMPRFVLSRIQPDFSKLSIAGGLSRMFGSQGRTDFGKNLFKFGLVCSVVCVLLQSERDIFVNAMVIDAATVPGIIFGMCVRLLAAVCTAMAALAGLDLVLVRIRWRRDLRMSRQELKDEHKQHEGDPFMKAKRRSVALERSRRKMIAAVPRANLVIANPTHYAIALRYVREEGGAPLVVAKGLDLMALKIREIAEANGIPVFEDKALARSMYHAVEVDRMIAPEFYRPVAELIHFIYAQNGKKAPANR